MDLQKKENTFSSSSSSEIA
ncbi:hypothetical protein CAEBREN_29604 [Caenorhabditis brenneri]|uniref:Uncharacterized protein n=1 Tax=Caenorhabditis brenneri TaxID=135651 RepID=G0P272_CAEBE|nr:hypothetical protein CAEBREN_29604 [Caenorhabditis brenneri]